MFKKQIFFLNGFLFFTIEFRGRPDRNVPFENLRFEPGLTVVRFSRCRPRARQTKTAAGGQRKKKTIPNQTTVVFSNANWDGRSPCARRATQTLFCVSGGGGGGRDRNKYNNVRAKSIKILYTGFPVCPRACPRVIFRVHYYDRLMYASGARADRRKRNIIITISIAAAGTRWQSEGAVNLYTRA